MCAVRSGLFVEQLFLFFLLFTQLLLIAKLSFNVDNSLFDQHPFRGDANRRRLTVYSNEENDKKDRFFSEE
jgi:hypothetical protein